MTDDLAILTLVVAAYALVAARLDRLSIGSALVFVVAGMLLSESSIGPISVTPNHEVVRLLAEGALTLLLFTDASSVRAHDLEHDSRFTARLLGIGLILTIVVGTAASYFLFPGISIGLALLIATILAPTDASLGLPVISNKAVPVRIRRLLNVESGLNDGIATPIVFLAIAIASTESSHSSNWVSDALIDIGIGVGVGIAVGLVGGLLLRLADERRLASDVSRQLMVVALALSCYLLAVSLDGNGFIGAFVGGLAFGAGTKHHEERTIFFAELQGSLLTIGVWTAFGLTVAAASASDWWDWRVILYATLSLTVLRMLPVAVALLGTRLRPLTVLFIGWFGPRGLASIVFLVIALEELHDAAVPTETLVSTVTLTVFLSVVLHGLTSGPLAAYYGRVTSALPPSAPELGDAPEPHTTRTSWSRGAQVAPQARASGGASDH